MYSDRREQLICHDGSCSNNYLDTVGYPYHCTMLLRVTCCTVNHVAWISNSGSVRFTHTLSPEFCSYSRTPRALVQFERQPKPGSVTAQHQMVLGVNRPHRSSCPTRLGDSPWRQSHKRSGVRGVDCNQCAALRVFRARITKEDHEAATHYPM